MNGRCFALQIIQIRIGDLTFLFNQSNVHQAREPPYGAMTKSQVRFGISVFPVWILVESLRSANQPDSRWRICLVYENLNHCGCVHEVHIKFSMYFRQFRGVEASQGEQKEEKVEAFEHLT